MNRFSIQYWFLLLTLVLMVGCKRDTIGLGRMSVEVFGETHRDLSDAHFEYLKQEGIEVINVQVVNPEKITFALNFIGQGENSIGVGVYEGDTTGIPGALTCSAVMVYDELNSYQSFDGTATIFEFDDIRSEFSGDFQMEMFNLANPSEHITVSGRITDVTLLSFNNCAYHSFIQAYPSPLIPAWLETQLVIPTSPKTEWLARALETCPNGEPPGHLYSIRPPALQLG